MTKTSRHGDGKRGVAAVLLIGAFVKLLTYLAPPNGPRVINFIVAIAVCLTAAVIGLRRWHEQPSDHVLR